MTGRHDLIVLGGGMVGAAAALKMAQQGMSVMLIDRGSLSPDQFELTDDYDLRQSAISPASQVLLHDLKVWPLVRQQRCCDYHRMTVWHENGGVAMNFGSEQIAASHLGTIVENRLVQQALLKQLRGMSRVDIRDQSSVVDIIQQADAVQVVLEEGSSAQASLLLAADGRNSTASRLLHLPVARGEYHQTAIVANVKTEKPHQDTAWQRFLHTGPLAFLPLADGQCSIVWSVDDERSEELMGIDDGGFLKQLSEAFEYRLGAVTATSQRAAFPLNWHYAERWLDGRVLLIGDAAHGVHPLAGQGVNLGFGDVALLGQLIAQSSDLADQKRLRRFERQRKAESVTALRLFTLLKQVYAQQNPLFCLARDLGMTMVENNRLLKRMVIQNAVSNMT